jgi:SAM-dependent methyltransferase
MPGKDEIAVANQQHWERMVQEGCGYTVPWLDLDVALIRRYARGALPSVPESLYQIYPANVLAGVSGKDVLCLAAGGGQQSAVYGLLGAQVTVVDFSAGQLEGDRTAAAHFGYRVTTVQADMRDLSCLGAEAFDLVYQGPSMSWVPDVREVYAGVARVLRPGGLYRVDFGNPATHFLEWDGEAYRITAPYTERVYRHETGAYDYRHYYSDIFGGLLDEGFRIEQVEDHPWSTPDPDAEPGSWAHEMAYNVGFVILASKRSTSRKEPVLSAQDAPRRCAVATP